MSVTLLGPRTDGATARVVAEVVPDGLLAVITAGRGTQEGDPGRWGSLADRVVDLALWRRWQTLRAEDAAYAAAETTLWSRMEALRAVYQLRLREAMTALDLLGRRIDEPGVRAGAVADATEDLRRLDDRHLSLDGEARTTFYLAVRLGERDSVRRERAEIGRLLQGCAGTVVLGGHSGVLLHLLHVFGLAASIRHPVVARSAGAMVLGDRVLVPGPDALEAYAFGLGLTPGLVALTSSPTMSTDVVGARCAPARVLTLDEHARVDVAVGVG